MRLYNYRANHYIGATATKGTGLPGTFGVDYDFINEASIDVMVDQNKVGSIDQAKAHSETPKFTGS